MARSTGGYAFPAVQPLWPPNTERHAETRPNAAFWHPKGVAFGL